MVNCCYKCQKKWVREDGTNCHFECEVYAQESLRHKQEQEVVKQERDRRITAIRTQRDGIERMKRGRRHGAGFKREN